MFTKESNNKVVIFSISENNRAYITTSLHDFPSLAHVDTDQEKEIIVREALKAEELRENIDFKIISIEEMQKMVEIYNKAYGDTVKLMFYNNIMFYAVSNDKMIEKYNEAHRDTAKFDNNIDLDKEKNREQSGFKDSKYADDLDDFTYELMCAIVGKENMEFERPIKEKPQSMADRIKAAKETSKERSSAQSLDSSNREISKEREVR